ncbi:MAG: lipoyl synthase [Candidatus Hydrothermales bacterium]
MKEKKPDWFKIKLYFNENFAKVRKTLREKNLNTVCEEALCPNINECWGEGTATIMIMGEICTRGCRFCNVKTGNPKGYLDKEEPFRVAQAVKEWDLKYVVLTSVDRDDLPDGGAEHFAKTISHIKKLNPNTYVEALIPDFQGNLNSLKTVLDSEPDVLAHNVETVERLTPIVRDKRANYWQSIKILEEAKKYKPNIYTKSGLMVGLSETEEEVIKTLRDLRNAGVDIVTIGQYLRPSSDKKFLEVKEYVHPDKFNFYREKALELGFIYCAAGPLVRSSYKAYQAFYMSFLAPKKTNLLYL